MSKRDLLALGLDASGGNRLLQSASTWSGLLVLNYHRIGAPDDSGFDPGLWSATVEDFEQQVRHLAAGCDVITVRDLPDVFRSKSGRYVMITFDDGYRDNYEAAYPILKAFGLPAVFFVCPGFIDAPRVPWWDEISWMVRHAQVDSVTVAESSITSLSLQGEDRQKALKALLTAYKTMPTHEAERFLPELAEACGSGRCPQEAARDLWVTWDMVREMHAGGMEIGGHTMTHPVLSQCDEQRQWQEVFGCQARLRDILGMDSLGFSYPVGGRDRFTATTESLVEQAGFRWAFSYHGGYQPLDACEPFRIPRVAVETSTNIRTFRSTVALPQLFA